MSSLFDRAQDFIWRNARLLDRHLFIHLFMGGSLEPVLKALRAYQNDDGGFGNALEPDMRCPTSQPASTEFALQLLDRVDAFTSPMVAPIFGFLTPVTTPEGGIPQALPSVREYPAAPWWNSDDQPVASLNPTASIVGLLTKHHIEHQWIDPATAYCWKAIEASEASTYHDLIPVITFLENSADRARADRELQRVKNRIMQTKAVAMDPEATGYVKKPLDWAPTPQSFCRQLFDNDVISTHLSALAGRQAGDGGWPINWEPVSHACEVEWRGWKTIEALTTLQAFGRI
jgi:hypothetical protein